MERYRNLGGNSGILGFEIGKDSITVVFKKGKKPYTYSYIIAGEKHVENMKILARKGLGLHSYIMKYVKNLYD